MNVYTVVLQILLGSPCAFYTLIFLLKLGTDYNDARDHLDYVIVTAILLLVGWGMIIFLIPALVNL